MRLQDTIDPIEHTGGGPDGKSVAIRYVTDAHRTTGWKDHARACFDRVFALLALTFFAPFLLTITILLLVREGRPILFRHTRIGRNGVPFKCLKFRTMAKDADARLARLLESDPAARHEWETQHKLENDPRVSCLGLFLRKTSFDELPQFLNVLKGDMAIVGPRPIVTDEAHHYGDHLQDYLSVKPGITGLWQVSGRSGVSYEERVALDVDYIRNRPFRRDLSIILKTVKVMLTREGAC